MFSKNKDIEALFQTENQKVFYRKKIFKRSAMRKTLRRLSKGRGLSRRLSKGLLQMDNF